MSEESKNVKLDLTSSALEKSIDSANSFLSKLISPAAEELGLLIKDKVTYWRLKQQVNTLNKAKAYCQKHNISPKAISIKLVVPLLENAGLEDDVFLQDKWAILLGNMVDSDQNIQNNVFPFVLGQVSKSEFLALEHEYKRINAELTELNKKIEKLDSAEIRKSYSSPEYRQLEELRSSVIVAKYLKESEFKDFEIANLVRCGLLKSIPLQYGYSKGVNVSVNQYEERSRTDAIEIDIEHVEDVYVFTELGKLFIEACNEKNSLINNS